MALSISHAGAIQRIGPSKIVVGILVAAMTAFVGLAGVANATSDKPTKQWCEQQGFKNYGQCVREWAHSKKPGGGGYGGYGSQTNVNADVETNVDLTVNGDNNVINIVINYLFGSNIST